MTRHGGHCEERSDEAISQLKNERRQGDKAIGNKSKVGCPPRAFLRKTLRDGRLYLNFTCLAFSSVHYHAFLIPNITIKFD